MSYIEKILVGLDFNGPVKAILSRASCMAKRFDAELIPLHAVEYMPFFPTLEPLRQIYDDLYNDYGGFYNL